MTKTTTLTCPHCKNSMVVDNPEELYLCSDVAVVAIWKFQPFTCMGCMTRFVWSPAQRPTVTFGFATLPADPGGIEIAHTLPRTKFGPQ